MHPYEIILAKRIVNTVVKFLFVYLSGCLLIRLFDTTTMVLLVKYRYINASKCDPIRSYDAA